MTKLGITGGIGSGKSTICRVFQLFGVPVYYADAKAKWLIENNDKLVNNIKKLLGEAAYVNGKYNTTYVGTKVFKDRNLLNELNSLVHPVVRQDWYEWSQLQLKKGKNLIVKEAAIMFSAEDDSSLDKVIYVFASEAVRVRRVLSRDPFRNKQAIESIITKQRSEASYREISDYIVDNDDESLVIPQVIKIIKKLGTIA